MTDRNEPAMTAAAPPEPGAVLTPDRWILFGFVLGVGLAMVVALASFLAISRLREDSAWVAHTQEVIGALEGVLAAATGAETAVLGYVIVGDDNLLETYAGAVRDLNVDLERIARLVKDPGQGQRAAALSALIEEHTAHLCALIAARSRDGFTAAQAFIAGTDYQRVHERIRPSVVTLEAVERGLLKDRLTRSETSARYALLTLGLGSLLSAGLAGLGLYAIRRWLAASRRTQEALLSANALLDRRVAEQTAELCASRALLEQIISSAPCAIFAIDRSHRYTSTNAAHLQICHKPAELVLGRTEHEVFARETADRLRAENEAIMGRAITRQFERELRRADGTGTTVITIKFPLRNARGEVVGLGGVSTDITARIQAEEAIRTLNAELEQRVTQRTAEAVAANAAKSQFLAHMSHEIRTPMNAILGLAQVLERDLRVPEQRQLLQSIRAAGRSLLDIVNEVLDLSKIEAGQIRLETRPFELVPILDQIEALLGEMARRKGLDFRIETPVGLADRLSGDPLRLQQVLVNLVDNAVKFTAQGAVKVRVRQQDLTAAAVRLRFEVNDTGIGIAPEHLATLGTPFVQADGTIARRFGGTGLGLAISKHLIELMGGTFGCDSTLNGGSRFRFELPCARVSGAPLPVPAAPPTGPVGPRLRGLHYLVVDDSEMNRDLVERTLTREGARVSLAADGQQALDFLLAQPGGCTAVLMDIQMPVMDGLTATRAIRGELGLRDLPVIALTAGVLVEQRQAALAAGVNDFLTKPVDLDELVAALLRWGAPADPAEPTAAAPPEPTPTTEPLADFPDIPGLDTRRAAILLGHDRAFFLDLLRQFAARFGTSAHALRDYLARGERSAAARHLHSLRGIAGSIGARDLIVTAQALESGIAEGRADIEVLLERFDGQCDALLAALGPWLTLSSQGAADPGGTAPFDPAAFKALCAALARRDLTARRLFSNLQPAIAKHYGETATQALAEAIRTLRFDDALAGLRQKPVMRAG